MKKQIAFVLTTLFMSLSIMAQEFEAPKNGAKLYTSNSVIEVTENGSLTFDLWLVRSKVAKKVSFESPRIISPAGGVFTVSEDPNNKDHYTVNVEAKDLAEGSYSITVMGKRNGIHGITGTILSLNVLPTNVVATKEGK